MTKRPLGHICDVVMGQAPSGTSYNTEGEGIPLLAGAGDFGDEYPNPTKFTTAPTKLAHQGDIILCIRATIGDLNWADGDYCLGRGVAGLRPKNGKLDKRYLWHWISNNKAALAKLGRGSTFKQVTRTDVETLDVPLPINVSEQRRVAAILDNADGMRRKGKEVLALADAFLSSAFLEMFGDPAFNPKGFEVKPVDAAVTKERPGVQSGPFGSALKKHEYVAEGVPVWGIDNVYPNHFAPTASLFITQEKYQDLKRYSVRQDDILISRAGTVGRMCVAQPLPEKSIIGTNLVRVSLDPKQMTPEYFVGLFTYLPHRLGRLKTNQKNNAFTFLNPMTLRAVEIPFPPVDLQQHFSSLSKLFRRLCARQEEQISEAHQLFRALSLQAFRGEL